jgi:hypothetical protein
MAFSHVSYASVSHLIQLILNTYCSVTCSSIAVLADPMPGISFCLAVLVVQQDVEA